MTHERSSGHAAEPAERPAVGAAADRRADEAPADAFATFGLARAFDVDADALRRSFLDRSRAVHPDAVAGRGADVEAAALRASAALNGAYETLRDPVRRAEHLLELCGGKSAAQDRRVPPEVLNEALLLREEIEEARAAGDAAALTAIKKGALARKGVLLGQIAELARRLGPDADEATRDALRLQLNAIKYVENLLSQL